MTVHPDRRTASRSFRAAVVGAALAVGLTAGLLVGNRGMLDPLGAGLVFDVAVLLGLLGLPSVSLRNVARFVAVAFVIVAVRFGVPIGQPTRDQAVIAGLVVSVVALLVLAHHLPSPTDGDRRALDAGRSVTPRRTIGAGPLAARIAGLSLVALVVIALLGAGLAQRADQGGSAAGDSPARPGGDDARGLFSPDRLDMTGRPRLSDRVVLRVRTDRSTFLRTGTYDRWDGRTWTRSDPGAFLLDSGGAVLASPDDLAADGPDVIEQTITLATPVATVFPTAPSATRVEAAGMLAQRRDGTILSAQAVGAGATYTVESRRHPLTEERLREVAGPVPPAVAERWASPVAATDRVVAAAREATAGATTTYDRVVALERWMAARTEYSIDAPLSPEGADVVDHFLFDSREGWCEQIASSLVVMARSLGIPARLVTGYVPGPRDGLSGEVVVREREAHAWAEVWFPEVGWVPFDPTADVPFAGQDQLRTWLDRVQDHAVVLGLGLALVGLAVMAAVVARRLRRRRRLRPRTPAGRLERELELVGDRAGRPRGAGESASAYAAAVAEVVGSPPVADVGRAVDASLYGPAGTPEPDWEEAGAALSAVRATARAPVEAR